jgi:hypothetical protein
MNENQVKKKPPQTMEALLKQQLKMHHKLLQKEIRKLMRTINVINHVDLQHELAGIKYPRKEAVRGAGMLSEHTKELIVIEKRRLEAQKEQEELKQKLKAADYKTLTGHTMLEKKDLTHSMPTLKRNLYAYQHPDSIEVGVGSFTVTRDLNRVIPKALTIEEKKYKYPPNYIPVQREDRYSNSEILGFSTESAFRDMQYNQGTPVSRGNSMIKETAKNIVDMVDEEYRKIILEKDGRLKPGK